MLKLKKRSGQTIDFVNKIVDNLENCFFFYGWKK